MSTRKKKLAGVLAVFALGAGLAAALVRLYEVTSEPPPVFPTRGA